MHLNSFDTKTLWFAYLPPYGGAATSGGVWGDSIVFFFFETFSCWEGWTAPGSHGLSLCMCAEAAYNRSWEQQIWIIL